MLGVSSPIAWIRRSATSQRAASGSSPGKCSFFTAAAPRSVVPR
jgi:hypothetical protein